jgi:dGTPase
MHAAHGGFEHNLQSLRVVDAGERYPRFDGLNLTFENARGHPQALLARERRALERREPGRRRPRFLERSQPSLEAQLCNLADEIAYNAHDIDDGVRSGLITLEQLEEVDLFEQHCSRLWLTTRRCTVAADCTRRSAGCSAPRSTT